MNEVITAHLTCEICGDTWFRDMTEKELTDYMDENPEANFRRATDPNDGEYVDLDGTVCDGCQDLYEDEFLQQLAEEEGIVIHTPETKDILVYGGDDES